MGDVGQAWVAVEYPIQHDIADESDFLSEHLQRGVSTRFLRAYLGGRRGAERIDVPGAIVALTGARWR